MNDLNSIKEYIAKHLDKKRYEHTVRVAELSEELAKHYKYDANRAKLAALLHDAAKGREDELLLKGYNISDIILRKDIDVFRPIIHAPLAAVIARDEFGIVDEEVLNAITYHTTGRPGMGTLEKIIFVADLGEPGRQYDFAREINAEAFKNLDECIIKGIDASLKHCISKGWPIYPLSVECRNYYITRR